ncbi:hypothetical protein KC332_g2187 [Hortaea werneckii]|uniref:Ubiquitin-like domain-containing protein n=1 Tax=Hortaea werneckii TaxID=91943 RepID=A0A3M7JBX4_HORWE|nr:hypothetical protein KC358_g6701 [Hortaea werneckii]KAI6850069.1 hypothetical protein KC350_g2300 [Hortaea werneckii]KAI6975631.1 hypothetical protein KC321_g4442 [Hortaea werneckii]KAI7042064.1 hypothetical protein KC366_g5026 [Hortaea werneckii]KAI7045661.1 hypothetical protein KC362_g2846 [Hortaea werneckii]
MAPATEPPSDISLRVKVPPGHLEGIADSFEIGSFPTTATIGAVRQRIQELAPGNPATERQRILYGGRALVDNEQPLADALNTKRDPSQTDYVLHLLVKPGPEAQTGHRRGVSAPGLNNASAAGNDEAQQQERIARFRQRTEELRQQGHMAQPTPPTGTQLPPGAIPIPHGAMRVGPGMPGFGQAIAQGQQQRAAMGMHGMHGTLPQQQNRGQDTAQPQQRADGQQQPQQQQHAQAHSLANGTPNPVHRPISGQGVHLEGVGPNGQRFQIHQQTLQFPHVNFGMPGQAPPPGFPPGGMPQLPGFQPGPSQQQQHLHMQQRPHVVLPAQPAQPGQIQQGRPRTALDQARDNIVEMRRMLDELRNNAGDNASEEEQQRISNLQERVNSINSYIDPFNLHNRGDVAASAVGSEGGRTSAPPAGTNSGGSGTQGRSLFGAQPGASGSLFGAQPVHDNPGSLFNGYQQPGAGLFGGQPPHATSLFGSQPRQQGSLLNTAAPPRATSLFQGPPGATLFGPQPQSQPVNPTGREDVSCYLLSSPSGPHALLFSPRHGTYTGGGGIGAPQAIGLAPTPTTPPRFPGAQVAGAQGEADPVAAAAAQHIANAQARLAAQGGAGANAQQQQGQAAQDPLAGPLGQLLNHMWLLLRILIFAYFLLGSNLGWRRPVLLMLLGLGFWAVRMGVLNEGGGIRRWWDDVVGVQRGRQPQAGAQEGAQQQRQGGEAGAQVQQGENAGVNGNRGQGGQQQDGRGRRMPTPEQVAQRLLNERQQRQNAQVGRLREIIRPIERAVALFLASLWPGIGEAAVRAREDEERRRNEEEVARQRAAEEERVRKEEEEKKAVEDNEKTTEGEASEGKQAVDVKEAEASKDSTESPPAPEINREGEQTRSAGD